MLQGTRERELPSQKALSLHLSLMDNPWHFSCALTVPCLCLGEPGSSLSPQGDRRAESGGVSPTSITSSASLPNSLSNTIRLTPFLKSSWLLRSSRPLTPQTKPILKACRRGCLCDTTLILGIDGNSRRAWVLFCFPAVLSMGKGLPLLSWLFLTHPAIPSSQASPCPSTERVSELWLPGCLGSFIICSLTCSPLSLCVSLSLSLSLTFCACVPVT